MIGNQTKFSRSASGWKETEPHSAEATRGKPGDILVDWEVLRLDEIVDFDPSRKIKKGDRAKFVAMTDVNVFDKKIKSYSEKEFNGGSKFHNGDTLLARITPCLENGKTAFVDVLDKNEIAGGSTEFIVMSGRQNKSIPEFIYYLAVSPEFREVAIQAMVGTSGRQRVQVDKLKSHRIAVPPLSEQQKIADVLGALDEKIELNRKMNKTLESLAQAIFKKWFIDDADPNWETKKLGDAVRIKYGKNLPTAELQESGYPVFGGNGLIGFFDKYLYELPQVLVACRGAASGKVNFSLPKSFVTNNSLVLEYDDPLNYEFLKYFALNADFYSCVSGSAQPQITIESLAGYEIMMPDREILNKFGQIVAPISQKILLNDNEISNLSQIRDSLLPRLMSGKLRVR